MLSDRELRRAEWAKGRGLMVLRFYPAQIHQDEDSAGGYGVVFADFPGCTSFGETVQAAAEAAAEALALHVEGMAEERLPFPQPSGPLDLPEWLAQAPGRVVTTVMVPVEAFRAI